MTEQQATPTAGSPSGARAQRPMPATPAPGAGARGGRVLFVHAHPDDEALQTGATMAKYAAEGDQVTLVTCTLGEEGEIVDESLSYLADEDDLALGAYRRGELANAMAALGITDFVRLGGDHRFRDSGMKWAEDGTATVGDSTREDSFWAADLQVAADELVAIIRDRRPQVLVTYDDFGGYGHPDHVKAHRVAMYATQLAAVPSYRRDLGQPWEVQRVLWWTMSRSMVAESVDLLRQGTEGELREVEDGFATNPDMPMLSDDVDIAVEIRAPEYAGAKMAALHAYPSQIRTDMSYMALPLEVSAPFWGRECYRFGGGVPLSEHPADDIFEGLR